MQPFIYNGLASRVIFGFGTLGQLPAEIDRLGLKRVIVLATPQQQREAQKTAAGLDGRAAGVFAEAAMHTPVEITERALEQVTESRADGVVAIGGGSTTGLAKAIALRSDLPQIVVPTTYAGSEMTPILGETKEGLKTTIRSEKVLPETVIYDVDLTLTLPAGLTATSGLNAIAHAVEALYAQDRNPIISMMAEEGIASLARALPRLMENPRDSDARSDALYGAWLCGTCLGAVGMALHHKLCHTLGGSFDLPHAETHTVVLPHAAAYNAKAAPDAMKRIARALSARSAPLGLYRLAKLLRAPTALRDIGMPADGIGKAVDIALQNPYWNPAPIERGAIHGLIERAWHGDLPQAS
ncbi:maleylacetate reductase [Rhizobium chutanense]|uniref:Maleylacetate reductase n=1 Tax=Rhizobium chutanense TaxID=2035448 RepID=A0A2A6JAU9_9HYPH|nr:maleylacetate reductase [Rhizobium chutanense]PDT03245.1 maleylacetate reductase [Rhizobium chutanense]